MVDAIQYSGMLLKQKEKKDKEIKDKTVQTDIFCANYLLPSQLQSDHPYLPQASTFHLPALPPVPPAVKSIFHGSRFVFLSRSFL